MHHPFCVFEHVLPPKLKEVVRISVKFYSIFSILPEMDQFKILKQEFLARAILYTDFIKAWFKATEIIILVVPVRIQFIQRWRFVASHVYFKHRLGHSITRYYLLVKCL